MFQQRSRAKVYEDNWCIFYKDEIEFPDGGSGTHTVLARNNGVAVLLVTPKDEVLLVKQFRYPVKSYEWELPGGGVDPGENLEIAAKREVKEETGITITNLEKVATYYPLSSAASEDCTLFIAHVPTISVLPHQTSGDEEITEYTVLPLEQAVEMVASGEVRDPFTGQALLLYYYKKSKYVTDHQ